MIHLGDITKINGYEAPIVDVVTFGAPCQDLSVAGKRAGMKHSALGDEETTRSGLFMDAIRIIKEMRENDRQNGRTNEHLRPRYAIYENVPGAFSSNRGEDFRVVLEEVARVVKEGVTIPRLEKGKWQTTGCIIGDGYSIAWRVFDAQYWGVPQRRRRICLIADFNGHTAPQILFEEVEHHGSTEYTDSKPSIGYLGAEPRSKVQPICEGLSRDTEPSREERQGTPTDTEGGFGASDSQRAYTMQDREGKAGGGKGALIAEELSATLRSGFAQTLFQPTYAVDMGGGKSACDIIEDKSPTLCTTHYREPAVVYKGDGQTGGDHTFAIVGDHENRPTDMTNLVVQAYRKQAHRAATRLGGYVWEELAPTLRTEIGDNSPSVAYAMTPGSFTQVTEDQAPTLMARDWKDPNLVCYSVQAVDCRNGTEDDVNGALQSNMAHSLNGNNVVRVKYIVRRLTPMECERLQGFPDNWTNIGEYVNSKGKTCKTSDAARYKALGNSIALPSWKWVLKRISAQYERDATMGSLFSGIEGFGLLWSQINGLGSVLFESEIDEFPSAVCRKHFGDETTREEGDFYEAILGRNKKKDVGVCKEEVRQS